MKTFLQCTECQVLCLEKSVPLPCNFDAYDLNGDKAIAFEEFMSATKGFIIMDRKTLFEAFDKNGKISLQWNTFSYVIVSLRIISRSFRMVVSGDNFIGVGEFKYVPRSIVKSGSLKHCLVRSNLSFCFGLCWGK